jgi:hypothetical protein
MSALSKVGMSVFPLLVVRVGVVPDDGVLGEADNFAMQEAVN